ARHFRRPSGPAAPSARRRHGKELGTWCDSTNCRAFGSRPGCRWDNVMAIVGFSGVVRGARFAGLAAVVILAASIFAGASGAAVSSTRAKGIDVSNWNGTINWTKVANAGYKFAIGKATEATSYEDATYATNRANSEA